MNKNVIDLNIESIYNAKMINICYLFFSCLKSFYIILKVDLPHFIILFYFINIFVKSHKLYLYFLKRKHMAKMFYIWTF